MEGSFRRPLPRGAQTSSLGRAASGLKFDDTFCLLSRTLLFLSADTSFGFCRCFALERWVEQGDNPRLPRVWNQGTTVEC